MTVNDDYGFAPDASRAQALAMQMQRTLGSSLLHVIDACRSVIETDYTEIERVARALLLGDRYPPITFGLFTDLVLAIEDSRHDTVTELIDAIGELQAAAETLTIHPLADPAGNSDTARLVRLMTEDDGGIFSIIPPDTTSASAFSEELAQAFAFLKQHIPELYREISALVTEIILVLPDPKAPMAFDGGSSYMLWGGMFLNARPRGSVVQMVELLAHESAHLMLFAFSHSEALVSNDAEGLYDSPLRSDPRPMDGIFHATWVSARMYWAVAEMIGTGPLSEAQRREAMTANRRNHQQFLDGYAVIEQHGTLTETGRSVMAAAKQYMQSVG